MIVVTVGTNEQPFDRLVRAAAALDIDDTLFVQHGASRVAHGPGEWVDFLTFDALVEQLRCARAVVCHAGVGSILLARQCGHQPIVVPRRHDLGEAVDDHQVPLARRLAANGVVVNVEDTGALATALRTQGPVLTAPAPAGALPGSASLRIEVRGVLRDLGAARRGLHAA